jgi:hypothetical protein
LADAGGGRAPDCPRTTEVPEAALEVLAILQRFIVEEPQTTRPNRGDFAWKPGNGSDAHDR